MKKGLTALAAVVLLTACNPATGPGNKEPANNNNDNIEQQNYRGNGWQNQNNMRRDNQRNDMYNNNLNRRPMDQNNDLGPNRYNTDDLGPAGDNMNGNNMNGNNNRGVR